MEVALVLYSRPAASCGAESVRGAFYTNLLLQSESGQLLVHVTLTRGGVGDGIEHSGTIMEETEVA